MFDWTKRDIEAEVREVLRARHAEDTSTAACKAWVRRLLQGMVPAWPERPLTQEERVTVGERFGDILQAVRTGRPPYDS